MKTMKIAAAVLAAALSLAPVTVPQASSPASVTASAVSISDLPAEYQFAADWIWTNRIEREQSTKRRNTVFDQIVAGKGTINYVVKWQSYRTVTYEQRQQFETMLSTCINAWNDCLAGYENWPYQHIDVRIVGWAVIDKSCLLDLHDDETVYTDTRYYDAQYDTTNGRDTIPDREPYAPAALSRFEHFTESGYAYPGGLDKRFDMYMWATQGFPDIGGCGGDWGQRLSDTAYLGMLDRGSLHVLEHEIGHGFGMTDFYGGEGESDGFPPGGFPGGENSIMMAGSAAKITDFDGWMLRYMWSHIKDDTQRFNLANAVDPGMTETITTTTTTETTVLTSDTAASSAETETTAEPQKMVWQVPTGGAQKLRLIASGMPWAGVSGQYGYWNNLTQEWVQVPFRYEDSLGESGSAAIEIDFGAAGVTDQLQVEVWYYAAWDNALGDMAACDPATLSFTAEPIAEETVTTTTTTVTETTESSTTAQRILRGDADCSGMVELSDAVLLAKASAGVAELSVAGKNNAELNGDGVITSDDLRLLLLYLSGSIDEL